MIGSNFPGKVLHTHKEVSMSMRAIATAVIAVALILSTRLADAGSITYTEMAVGSGSLGGASFTNALITLTATADTTEITNPSPGLFEESSSFATVSVATVGSGILTAANDVFDFQPTNGAGIESGFGMLDILDSLNPVFATLP
jgi:hypothetical protein